MGDADINTLTMEQYLALTRRNKAPSMVKPEIGGNVNLEIKSQFIREFSEDTFLGNKNDDAYEHVERILDIASLLNIPRNMTQSCCVYFPSLLLELQRDGWIDYLQEQSTPRIFSRRPSFKGLDTMTRQLLDSQGPIPNKTLAQASDAIQTMDDHSKKWHDLSTSRKASNGISDGISAITSKLDSLGRDMKKLKENVHAIQVGCENWGGAHLNKECPLNEEVKSVEEFKDGEFGQPFPNNNGNGARYHVGPPRYYIRVDNRPPLEIQIEQQAKDYQAKAANEVLDSSVGQYKAIFTNNKVPTNKTSSKGTNELHRVSFIYDDHVQVSKETGEGASVNIMPRSMFSHLKLTNLKETNMLVEMADMTKKPLVGLVENVLVKIDKFLFPSDFMIIDMLGDPNETMILGRPFLANIHARIDVLDCFEEESEISKDLYSRSLDEYKVVFDIEIEQLTDKYELGIGKKGFYSQEIEDRDHPDLWLSDQNVVADYNYAIVRPKS
ncbi:7-deoxyloganetin glucosyltransferase-like protein [Tanacetum coccineum]